MWEKPCTYGSFLFSRRTMMHVHWLIKSGMLYWNSVWHFPEVWGASTYEKRQILYETHQENLLWVEQMLGQTSVIRMIDKLESMGIVKKYRMIGTLEKRKPVLPAPEESVMKKLPVRGRLWNISSCRHWTSLSLRHLRNCLHVYTKTVLLPVKHSGNVWP